MRRLVRIVLIMIVAAAAIWLLFTAIFPWIESYMENPSIGLAHM